MWFWTAARQFASAARGARSAACPCGEQRPLRFESGWRVSMASLISRCFPAGRVSPHGEHRQAHEQARPANVKTRSDGGSFSDRPGGQTRMKPASVFGLAIFNIARAEAVQDRLWRRPRCPQGRCATKRYASPNSAPLMLSPSGVLKGRQLEAWVVSTVAGGSRCARRSKSSPPGSRRKACG